MRTEELSVGNWDVVPAQSFEPAGDRATITNSLEGATASGPPLKTGTPLAADPHATPPSEHRAPAERGPRSARPLEAIGRGQIGSVVEMQAVKNVWQAVRIVDVQKEQVQVVPQKIQQGGGGGKNDAHSSWTMRWVEFKRGLFRSTSRPLEQASSSNGDTHVSRAAAQAAEILDKRPVREVKKPEAFSPRRTADIKRRPPPPPEPPAAASKAARAPRPSSAKAAVAGGRRTTEAAAAAAARRRKEAKEAAALTSSSSAGAAGAARGGKREASGEAAGGGNRAAKKARTSSSSSNKSKARKTEKGGGKGGHSSSNSSRSNGAQVEGGEEGSSGSSKPNGGAHRRDWGLMHMGDVGRNKPPFARTLLFKGSLNSGVRFSGEPSPQNTRWVVKRWPEKSTRRKVDLEVHELIRQNPCHNIVEIVGVDANDGVLMEYCPDGDLQALLAKSRRKYMPLRHVAVRLLGLMQGLAHLHKLNIVHSDVSPANVFLRPAEAPESSNGSDSDDEEEGSSSQDGDAYLECVLGDFGHSYVLEQHTESRSSVANHCGSEFVAPEVENGSVSTMASDVYSAGMILSQLVTMCSQFKENFGKESTSLVRALSNLAKSMSQERPHMRPTAMACVKALRKTMMGWGS